MTNKSHFPQLNVAGLTIGHSCLTIRQTYGVDWNNISPEIPISVPEGRFLLVSEVSTSGIIDSIIIWQSPSGTEDINPFSQAYF